MESEVAEISDVQIRVLTTVALGRFLAKCQVTLLHRIHVD